MKLTKKIVMALAIVITFISGGAKGFFGSLAMADTPENAVNTNSNIDQQDDEIASNFAKLYPNAAQILIQKAEQAQANEGGEQHSGGSCD